MILTDQNISGIGDYAVQIDYIDDRIRQYKDNPLLSFDVAILEAISENLFRLKGLDK